MPVYNSCEITDFDKIKDFQKGAMQLVNDYTMEPPYIDELSADIVVKAYKQLAYYPTRHQAKELSYLQYEDGGGGNVSHLSNFHKGSYLRYPRRLVKDYMSSRWKEGFLKQVIPFVNPHIVDSMIKYRQKNPVKWIKDLYLDLSTDT